MSTEPRGRYAQEPWEETPWPGRCVRRAQRQLNRKKPSPASPKHSPPGKRREMVVGPFQEVKRQTVRADL